MQKFYFLTLERGITSALGAPPQLRRVAGTEQGRRCAGAPTGQGTDAPGTPGGGRVDAPAAAGPLRTPAPGHSRRHRSASASQPQLPPERSLLRAGVDDGTDGSGGGEAQQAVQAQRLRFPAVLCSCCPHLQAQKEMSLVPFGWNARNFINQPRWILCDCIADAEKVHDSAHL